MQPVKILHSSKHVSLFCLPQAGESCGLSGGRTVPTSHCPEARWQDNPGAAATPSRAAVMRGDRAAISDADGHTGGGKGDSSGPHEEYYDHETAPFDRYGIPFGNKGPMRIREGPTVRIRLPPAGSRQTIGSSTPTESAAKPSSKFS